MKILTFAGSLRKDSMNKKVCAAVEKFVNKEKLADIEYCDLQPLDIPVYDGDIEARGLPPGVQKLIQKIQGCQALIISSPEYNGSISSPLKNTLDWVSRYKPDVLPGKHVLLMAASPGAMGGVRTLWHSRQPMEALGCHVYSEMLGIAKAHEALNEKNEILDEKTKAKFEKLVRDFISFAGRK